MTFIFDVAQHDIWIWIYLYESPLFKESEATYLGTPRNVYPLRDCPDDFRKKLQKSKRTRPWQKSTEPVSTGSQLLLSTLKCIFFLIRARSTPGFISNGLAIYSFRWYHKLFSKMLNIPEISKIVVENRSNLPWVNTFGEETEIREIFRKNWEKSQFSTDFDQKSQNFMKFFNIFSNLIQTRNILHAFLNFPCPMQIIRQILRIVSFL